MTTICICKAPIQSLSEAAVDGSKEDRDWRTGYESVGGCREERMNIVAGCVIVDDYLTLQLIGGSYTGVQRKNTIERRDRCTAPTRMPRYKLLEGQVSIRNNCRERDATAMLTSGYEWKSGVRGQRRQAECARRFPPFPSPHAAVRTRIDLPSTRAVYIVELRL